MTKLLAINNSVTVDDRGNVTQLFLFIAGFAVVGAAATSYLFFYYLYKIKIMKQFNCIDQTDDSSKHSINAQDLSTIDSINYIKSKSPGPMIF